MSDKSTLDVYARQAEDYVALVEAEAAKDGLIARFISSCPDGGRVLDLGCGPGHYAGRMAAEGLRVDAMDAVPEMIEKAKTRKGVTSWVGRFEDLTAEHVYDGIWAYFSLLHAPRTEMDDHLAAIYKALKPGGLFYVGLKRGTGGKADAIGRFYEYYELPELEERLSRAGFTIEKHWYGEGKGLSGSVDGWIVIAAHA